MGKKHSRYKQVSSLPLESESQELKPVDLHLNKHCGQISSTGVFEDLDLAMHGIASSPLSLRNLSWNPHKCSGSLSPFHHPITKHCFLTTINRMAFLFKWVYYKNEMRGDAQGNENVPCLPPPTNSSWSKFHMSGRSSWWKRLICHFLSIELNTHILWH